MAFLKKISISTKVFGGFGVVLALLLTISVVGGLNLTGANDNFKRYRAIALQTNEAGRVQSNLLEARMGVKNFVINGSEKAIAAVRERGKKTLELNQSLEKLADTAEKKKVTATTDSELKTYLSSFDEAVKLQARRQDLVLNTLDKVGPQIERKLSEIMKSAYRDGDAESAYFAGVVQRDLLMMRLYLVKFLLTNEKTAFDRMLAESADMAEHEKTLLGSLRNPAHRKLAEETTVLQKTYVEAAKGVYQTINQRNDIIRGTLDVIGPRVAKAMEELKLAVKKEQDTLGPKASAEMEDAVMITIVVSIVSVLFGMIAAWLIGKGISNPIQAITGAMTTLAGGDKTIEIPGQDHGDEVGDMAAAVQVFKENMIKADELQAKELEEARAREERGKKIEAMTQEFDKGVAELLSALTSSATEMEGTAGSMSKIAEDTSLRSTNVAAAAEQASANVQTVATATEELSSSIQEISRQVAQSSSITNRAVDEANQTNAQIQGLSEAAQKIGEVVDMISDIAEQTNLLALNATIESARAGEAGKGFAVVASEVKSLANETAKATEQISQQISEIQTETDNAVTAIRSIGSTIDEVSTIATTIASAVEEQGAATGEIARNVEQAATGTQDVTNNIVEVTRAAGETGAAAQQVTSVAGELNERASSLQSQVERFLADVRAV